MRSLLSLTSVFALLRLAQSINVGDYVASGLGLSSTATSSSPEAPQTSFTNTSHWSNGTTVSTASLTSLDLVGSISQTSSAATNISRADTTGHSTTSHLTTQTLASNANAGLTSGTGGPSSSGAVANATANKTLTLSGDCWQQWSEYWSAGSTTSTVYVGTYSYYTTTFTNYYATGYSYVAGVEPGSTYIQTDTEIIDDGPNHPISTYTSTETDIMSSATDWSFSTTATTSSSVITYVGSQYSYTTVVSVWEHEYAKPNCTLPSTYMPECQAQWSTFIANDEVPYDNTVSRPKCTQASITGTECSSLVAAYYFSETMYGQMNNPGYISTNGSSSYW